MRSIPSISSAAVLISACSAPAVSAPFPLVGYLPFWKLPGGPPRLSLTSTDTTRVPDDQRQTLTRTIDLPESVDPSSEVLSLQKTRCPDWPPLLLNILSFALLSIVVVVLVFTSLPTAAPINKPTPTRKQVLSQSILQNLYALRTKCTISDSIKKNIIYHCQWHHDVRHGYVFLGRVRRISQSPLSCCRRRIAFRSGVNPFLCSG